MKIAVLISLFIFSTINLMGQTNNPNYDANLAKTLGADNLGMKMYVMVILKTGSNKVADKAKRDSLFAGHFANINRLIELKKMVIAGPFEQNEKTYRGIFILDVNTFEEATALLETDPTIKGKIFETEMFHWYGSAALPEYLHTADKLWKTKP